MNVKNSGCFAENGLFLSTACFIIGKETDLELMMMNAQITQAEQNLYLLRSLLPEGESFHIWGYSSEGRLIGCSCQGMIRETLHHAFQALGAYDKMLAYAAEGDNAAPRILGSSIGLQWAITLETERKNNLVFVLGPVLNTPISEKSIRSALMDSYHAANDTGWIDPLCAVIPALPVMSYAVFGRYVMLVHNVLTGDQLGIEALNPGTKSPENEQTYEVSQRNRIDVYQSEQGLLDVVRRGEINYYHVLNHSSSLSPGVPVHGRDPLRQIKTSIVVFTTLVTRAAMEGGLSPEIAYPLGDSYIQTAEDCRDSGELDSLAHAMYHDFIYRVHQLRANPHCSHAIQKCCDYIELSLDRKIHAKDLAILVGYTEYYLTEKFKNETGLSVSDYVRRAKIRRAKMMLQSTDLSVSEIADRLAFNSANYLIRVFKELEGCTPAAYRERHHSETPMQS